MEFRKYQLEIIKKGADVLGEHGFLYLAMEVRTGKTLTSLGIAGEMKVNSVLFVTKMKLTAWERFLNLAKGQSK